VDAERRRPTPPLLLLLAGDGLCSANFSGCSLVNASVSVLSGVAACDKHPTSSVHQVANMPAEGQTGETSSTQ